MDRIQTWAEQYFGSAHAGMYFLAGTALLGTLMLLRSARTGREPGTQGDTALSGKGSR